MSGLELNKVIAAVLTAGVIASTCAFITHLMISPATITEHAYPIQIAEAATGGTAVEAAAPALEPIEPLMASAEIEAGIKVAKKCTACHTFEEGGADKIGPNLYGIMGRNVAADGDYAYSKALEEKSGEIWDYGTLNAYLAKPRDWAPGTKMTFAGLKKPADRANVVAYLRSLSGSPVPLPE